MGSFYQAHQDHSSGNCPYPFIFTHLTSWIFYKRGYNIFNNLKYHFLQEKAIRSVLSGLNKSFCRGPGGSFFKKRPLVAEGKTRAKQTEKVPGKKLSPGTPGT
jgi:hypothetical protein